MREGFAGINARLDHVVSAPAFAAEQRRIDEALNRLAGDIIAEREDRKVGDLHQQKSLDKLVANQRWIIAAVVVPVALFLASIYLARGQ